jgi:diguanylate cyclase (GGDEF)-like protein
MTSHHSASRASLDKTPSLKNALEKNRQVKTKIEICAAELSTVNESVKQRVVAGRSLLEAEKVLARSEELEDKVQEWVDELHYVNAALAHEIDARQTIDRELLNTLQRLSIDEDISSTTGDILTIAHEVVEEATKRTLLDYATGIPTRELFNDRLEQALALIKRHGWDMAVLFIDLDRFKLINDTYGHGIGDKVLQIVAQRLATQARHEDTICRYGGDEFLYLLVNPKGTENISRVARKVFDLISQPSLIDNLILMIEPSIGIAVYPEDGTSGEELVSNADAAMYRAKDAKTGPVFFNENFLARFSKNESPSGSSV